MSNPSITQLHKTGNQWNWYTARGATDSPAHWRTSSDGSELWRWSARWQQWQMVAHRWEFSLHDCSRSAAYSRIRRYLTRKERPS